MQLNRLNKLEMCVLKSHLSKQRLDVDFSTLEIKKQNINTNLDFILFNCSFVLFRVDLKYLKMYLESVKPKLRFKIII